MLEFGVSGLLYEANLLMYDRATESLWSQSLGEAVVGSRTGSKLEIVPMQLLRWGELREKHPDAMVLSQDTGHTRDYELNPYSGYEVGLELPSGVDQPGGEYHPKQSMYVFAVGDISVAFAFDDLSEGGASTEIAGRQVVAERDGGEVFVTVDGDRVPGYIEMWFSWDTRHRDSGQVWDVAPGG